MFVVVVWLFTLLFTVSLNKCRKFLHVGLQDEYCLQKLLPSDKCFLLISK